MAGTINDFRGSFKTDLAKPSRFDVTIPIPLSLGFLISSARSLSFRCESAQLPGRTFETATKKMGSAPVEYFPYHTNYQMSTMTFIVTSDMNEKVFFDSWMELINPTTDYNFQYKNNYAVDISVNQYNNQNQLTYSCNLVEAFPIDVNQLDLDWSSDGHHKLTVTFAYTYWKNNSLQALGMELVDAGISNVADMVGGLGGSASGAINTAIDSIPNKIQNTHFTKLL